jgi:3,4-dihydroxy 2-butanone 4-phosphate synthase/GTP cyclohydrolase II
VLVRAGHTEAAVDVARLAGLYPAGVICEIMNDDGTMARTAQLLGYADEHGLKIGTIADLIAYRRRYDKIVERAVETSLDSLYGGAWKMIVYKNQVGSAEHIAMVKGDISDGAPVLTRLHALHVLDDVLGDRSTGKGGELQQAMRMVAEAGRGVVVVLREARPTSLSERIRVMQEGGEKLSDLRDYGMGAQTLLDLGVRQMILLSNRRRTIVGLEGYGLSIVEQRGIPHTVVRGDS